MRSRRVLIGLFLLATVLVDLAVLCVAGPSGEIRAALLATSQSALMGIWLALGKTAGPWRLLGAVLFAVAWSCAAVRPLDIYQYISVAALLFLVLPTLGSAIPLLVARMTGLRVVDPTTESPDQGPAVFQFSLGLVLGWITVTAITLSALKCVALEDWREALSREPVDVLWVLAIAPGIVASVALWISLGNSRWVWRLLGLVLIGWLAEVCSVFARLPLEAIVWVALQVGSLWVFRVAGYRLQWRARRH
jgi:hypothetical protein